jgi:hypothetical protein
VVERVLVDQGAAVDLWGGLDIYTPEPSETSPFRRFRTR